MKTYHLKLELLSPALAGSGEGYGAIIDSDIVFDDIGIPYIPAKRIKGCLLDSANEVKDMFTSAGIGFNLPISNIFGDIGTEHSAPVYFSNLTIENYDQNKAWLKYYLKMGKYKNILSKENILECFTEIRQQTRIDETDGVAFEGSLRTSRLIRKGWTFTGEVVVEHPDQNILETLALACMNFRRFGTSRNRGFGEVRCTLLDGGNEISIQSRLEELCTN